MKNNSHETGPFDIIGDVHGCFDELYMLLKKLDYQVNNKNKYYRVSHSDDRKIIFVGDLVDRGPNTPEVLRIVMDMVDSGVAFCVNGNHDDKLKRKLQGRDVKITHGLDASLAQLEQSSPVFKNKVIAFLDSLTSHFIFDNGKLVVTHAALKESYIGIGSPRIQAYCMYGETTGKVDAAGLPERLPWAQNYQGKAMIVYGHTPIEELIWINNTVNIDTGCVFGGKLTALRYPERVFVCVPAKQVYWKS